MNDRYWEDQIQADPFELPEWARHVMEIVHQIPDDLRDMLIEKARQLWPVAGWQLRKLVALAYIEMKRGMPIQPALYKAANRLGMRQLKASPQPGLSTTQVQQYRGRQMQRLPSTRRKLGYRSRG